MLQKLDASSQLALIDDLHRDLRSVSADVKGQHLPGFCLPKKVRVDPFPEHTGGGCIV